MTFRKAPVVQFLLHLRRQLEQAEGIGDCRAITPNPGGKTVLGHPEAIHQR